MRVISPIGNGPAGPPARAYSIRNGYLQRASHPGASTPIPETATRRLAVVCFFVRDARNTPAPSVRCLKRKVFDTSRSLRRDHREL